MMIIIQGFLLGQYIQPPAEHKHLLGTWYLCIYFCSSATVKTHRQWQRLPLSSWMCVGPAMSIVAFEQCRSLLYPFCQTICEGQRKNERELIEWNDWHGICCSFASWDKTTMTFFDPIDTTDYSFSIISIIYYYATIKQSCVGNIYETTTYTHHRLSKRIHNSRGRRYHNGCALASRMNAASVWTMIIITSLSILSDNLLREEQQQAWIDWTTVKRKWLLVWDLPQFCLSGKRMMPSLRRWSISWTGSPGGGLKRLIALPLFQKLPGSTKTPTCHADASR